MANPINSIDANTTVAVREVWVARPSPRYVTR